MSSLKVVSLNTNGLKTKEKVHKFAIELQKHSADIIICADTRLDEDSLTYLINYLPNYKIYGTTNEHAARGVAILLNKRAPFEVQDCFKDQTCNYMILKIQFEIRTYAITAFYGPNIRDDPEFIRQLFFNIDNMSAHDAIIGGDFNFFFNKRKDSRGYVGYDKLRSMNKFKDEMRARLFADSFRVKNPDGFFLLMGRIFARRFKTITN